MFAQFVLAGLLALDFSLPYADTADLSTIKRVILKEPTYQGTPKYCLLAFGQDAKTRIWLVHDGKYLYVDRNGNGDLTEPDEKRTSPYGSTYLLGKIVERDGTVHEDLRLTCHADGTFEMILNPSGGPHTQFVGVGNMDRPTFGASAAKAPIIHFGGPLTLERYGPLHTIPRAGHRRSVSLRLMLGTPGIGKGPFASYDELCSDQLGKIHADIVYPHATKIGEAIEQRLELVQDG